MIRSDIHEAISAFAQLGMVFATAGVAWVGYIAFVGGQKSKQADDQRKEKLKLVASLISALEVYFTKISQSNAVSVTKVPFFTRELADVEAAIGMARVHGYAKLVDSATHYVRAGKDWRRSIVRAKGKRPAESSGASRPPEYVDALAAASKYYERTISARDAFFREASSLLKFSVPSAQSEVPMKDSDAETGEAAQ